MPPKKMMQGWRVYATLMLYVVPLFESPMVTMYDDVCVDKMGWTRNQNQGTSIESADGKQKQAKAAELEDTDH